MLKNDCDEEIVVKFAATVPDIDYGLAVVSVYVCCEFLSSPICQGTIFQLVTCLAPAKHHKYFVIAAGMHTHKPPVITARSTISRR